MIWSPTPVKLHVTLNSYRQNSTSAAAACPALLPRASALAMLLVTLDTDTEHYKLKLKPLIKP
jgi:hypothetical protein